MALAPPYIPRSIRVSDQSTDEPNHEGINLSLSTVGERDRQRIDVNTWLNSIQQVQSNPENDGVGNNSPNNLPIIDGLIVLGGDRT
jgi:hypothetical protein